MHQNICNLVYTLEGYWNYNPEISFIMPIFIEKIVEGNIILKNVDGRKPNFLEEYSPLDISGILAGVDDDIDVPDWGWCSWWHYGWSAYSLMELYLKFGWNLLSLKASRTLSKMDDISGVFAGVDDDCGCTWLGLVSLMTFWMVCICPQEAMFKIWLKSDEFEGIKNPLKDGWHFWSFCWSWWWLWMFLLEDAGGSWLVLVSLMVFWIIALLVGSSRFKFH